MLTVLSVAYPLAPVGEDAVGGAEQVLSALDRALVRAGHRSLVIACEGSSVQGELFSLARPSGALDAAARDRVRVQTRQRIDAVMSQERVDLVHMHGVDFFHYLPTRESSSALLVTLHLPLDWYPAHALRPARARSYLHCVSAAQRARCPANVALLDDIPNGVRLDSFRPFPHKADYALVLGRVCPEKGIHLAIDAAKRAGAPLLIAGRVFPYPEHERYFCEEIVPRLDRQRRFIGAVGMAQKAELLARARAVIVPSLVAETSSLTAMEALASGTQVVAFRIGALPDLIEHGVTGWLVDSVEEMAAAMGRAELLSSSACRSAAEARFSETLMTTRYLDVYERLSERPSGPPVERSQRVARAKQSTIYVEEIRSIPELFHKRDEWSALWQRCADATVFQTPEWLCAWCEQLLHGEVFVLALSQGERLIGLVPLFRWRDGDARVLSLMGAGVSDYQDALIEPQARPAALPLLERWLLDHRREWDRLELSELVPDSVMLSLGAQGGLRREDEAQEVCPAIVLPQALTGLPEVVTKDLWASLKHAQRRAVRELSVSFESVSAESFEPLFDGLVRFHAQRRSARNEVDLLQSSPVQAFHRKAALGLLERDMLALYGLRFDGELAACFYGFHDRKTTRAYMSTFAAAHGRRSPGTLIVGHAIEQAVLRGASLFDFLRGGEDHKYRWGARDRLRIQRRRLYRDSEPSELGAAAP